MAESLVLSAFLQALFQSLLAGVKPALDELRLEQEVKDKLVRLAEDLLVLQTYLRDAENKQQTNATVRLWLRSLQDVAYDANDVLDECALEAQRQKVIVLAQLRKSVSLVNPKRSLFLHKVSRRERDIKLRMEALQRQRHDYGLKVLEQESPPHGSETTSLGPPEVIGRGEDKANLVRMLTQSSGVAGEFTVSVICIVGIGGLGKTTLAQSVYNDEAVEDNFTVRSWVHVSQDFREDKLTKEILESIDGSPHPNVSLDNLQKELLKKLRGKKFLLVLDDVWIEDWRQWHKFRTPLLQGCMGSKILVTTTSNDVAKALTSSIYRLPPLRDDDFWSLFFYYMVQQNPNIRLAEVAMFEREIARNCNGLPSAAMDLAVRLSMEPDRSRWRSVLQADNQHSDSSRADLRYRLLPAHLRPCFSFCSVFPIGFEFEEEELVRLWMSQNFILPCDQDLRTEDVGSTWFDLLKRRSFFQFSRFDRKTNRSKYTIPEPLHKFFKRGRRIAEPGNGFAKTRHLSLMPQEKPSLFNRESVTDQLKGLYTLIVFDESVTELPDDFTKKFKRLRTLDLSHTGIHKLPDSIHHLKHLRCLQLGGTNITRLPDALCCLYFLQTLGLQNCAMLEELPKEMKYLQCLRHIDLHWDYDSLMAPGHIPRLVGRRHALRFMPPEMGLLVHLQTLNRFVVSEKNGCGVGELENMRSLHGELLVSNLQLVRYAAEAKAANLQGKEHLQCLELQWTEVDKETAKFPRNLFRRDSAESILCELQPHPNLKKMSIVGYMGTYFPSWLGSFSLSNLTTLALVNCSQCASLPPLGNLPALSELHFEGLHSVADLDSAFCCRSSATPFRALRKLHFENMPSLHQWHGDGRCVLSSLRELIIKDCSSFQKISHHMPYLEKLVIKGSPKLASLPALPCLNSLTVSRNGRFIWQLLPPLTSLLSLRLKGLGEAYLHQGSLRGLNSLQRLEIVSCFELIKLPEDWQHANLVYLRVKHCPKLRLLPGELGNFRVLQDLEIQHCPSLSSLPEQVARMKSLERLEISDCPSLLAMPSSLPTSLHVLSISNCRWLKWRCKEGGEDWPKIKNVFSVWVDGDVILPFRRV